jgi:hypothetical protein
LVKRSPFSLIIPEGQILNERYRLISTVDFQFARYPPI